MAKKKDAGTAKNIGRWVPIGMKPATADWKNVNPSDEHVIYLLDSASGEITLCGDASGVRTGLGSPSVVAPVPTTAKRRKPARSAS